jgi:hypothetical protein
MKCPPRDEGGAHSQRELSNITYFLSTINKELECRNPNHPGHSPRKGRLKQVGIKKEANASIYILTVVMLRINTFNLKEENH